MNMVEKNANQIVIGGMFDDQKPQIWIINMRNLEKQRTLLFRYLQVFHNHIQFDNIVNQNAFMV
ncbi:unnamed protein product [Paramecium sonneborni]|uniref:Uncharacterized protein n=1 Tax=Paramecium sonneborni TaxID=65129 RepID=A0A8S1RNM0_9CILI|nr:unnamed protein product [Paramecium sonneborni]